MGHAEKLKRLLEIISVATKKAPQITASFSAVKQSITELQPKINAKASSIDLDQVGVLARHVQYYLLENLKSHVANQPLCNQLTNLDYLYSDTIIAQLNHIKMKKVRRDQVVIASPQQEFSDPVRKTEKKPNASQKKPLPQQIENSIENEKVKNAELFDARELKITELITVFTTFIYNFQQLKFITALQDDAVNIKNKLNEYIQDINQFILNIEANGHGFNDEFINFLTDALSLHLGEKIKFQYLADALSQHLGEKIKVQYLKDHKDLTEETAEKLIIELPKSMTLYGKNECIEEQITALTILCEKFNAPYLAKLLEYQKIRDNNNYIAEFKCKNNGLVELIDKHNLSIEIYRKLFSIEDETTEVALRNAINYKEDLKQLKKDIITAETSYENTYIQANENFGDAFNNKKVTIDNIELILNELNFRRDHINFLQKNLEKLEQNQSVFEALDALYTSKIEEMTKPFNRVLGEWEKAQQATPTIHLVEINYEQEFKKLIGKPLAEIRKWLEDNTKTINGFISTVREELGKNKEKVDILSQNEVVTNPIHKSLLQRNPCLDSMSTQEPKLQTSIQELSTHFNTLEHLTGYQFKEWLDTFNDSHKRINQDLKSYQDMRAKALELDQRLQNEVYSASLKMLTTFENVLQKLIFKYNSDANISTNIKEYLNSIHLQSNKQFVALQEPADFDVRINTIIRLRNDLIQLNNQYINENINKKNTASYYEDIEMFIKHKLHNETIEQMSDIDNNKFCQEIRSIIGLIQRYISKGINKLVYSNKPESSTYTVTLFASKTEKELVECGNDVCLKLYNARANH